MNTAGYYLLLPLLAMVQHLALEVLKIKKIVQLVIIMSTCYKCNVRPAAKDSGMCEVCSNGTYNSDTGIGVSSRHTDGQGRRRNHF